MLRRWASGSRSSGGMRCRTEAELARDEQEVFCDYANALGGGVVARSDRVAKRRIKFEGVEWEMFVHNSTDIVSNTIMKEAKARGLQRHEATLLDIGGNVGWFTLHAAAQGFRVIAFEPYYVNAMLMRRSICANPQFADRITLYTMGLSNETRNDCFMGSADDNQGNTVLSCGAYSRPDLKVRTLKPVPQRSLDDMVAAEKDVVMIKMDVEGHEGIVVHGGRRTFAAAPYVMLELTPDMQWAKAGVEEQTPPATLDFFTRAGFEVRLNSWTDTAPQTAQQLTDMGLTGKGKKPAEAYGAGQVLLCLSKAQRGG